MQKLLSLPPNLVDCFHEIEGTDHKDWFCTSDPVGAKLGSGGGTTWLLAECQKNVASENDFSQWISQEKRILLHAGGQSRRLPGYAPSGKILTPIPVFRWERGQRLKQNLLSLQLPLYEQIMKKAPDSLHTLIASGDVYIRSEKSLQPIPEADVVCYGLWVDPSLATHHGVFVSNRKCADQLDFMLQKPSLEELGSLAKTHMFLMDIGIWILSDRAIELLMKRSHKPESNELKYYDLYSDFGMALGNNPCIKDEDLNALSVAILPLPGGEFYHYGTSTELISSTLAVQNLVRDQREIMQRKVKPHPAMFVQNAEIGVTLTADNSELWIENSFVGKQWSLTHQHIITGVPENDWVINLPVGVCVDVVPIGEQGYAARPYGLNDAFKGALAKNDTFFMGKPFMEWLSARGVNLSDELFGRTDDLQAAKLFPICQNTEELGKVLRWMIFEPESEEGKGIWERAVRLSADELSAKANLKRLYAQREEFRNKNWPALAANYDKSVFYQLNLADAAAEFAKNSIALPEILAEDAPQMTRIHNQMFRARALQLQQKDYKAEEQKAFSLLREGLIGSLHAEESSTYIAHNPLHSPSHAVNPDFPYKACPAHLV